MVRELLEGTKTQTRRIIKNPDDGVSTSLQAGDGWVELYCRYEKTGSEWHKRPCPYGKAADLLWVKETFLGWYRTADNSFDKIAAYRADGYQLEEGERWKPSIFMPRTASRLTLEITDIRAQRLLDISEDDAAAEGVPPMMAGDRSPCAPRFVAGYRQIWEAINGAGSWEKNPWVWALTFKVHHKNVDERLLELSRC